MEVRILDSPLGKMIVTHLIVDVRDAMGANAVNTMCEALASMLEEIDLAAEADGMSRSMQVQIFVQEGLEINLEKEKRNGRTRK